MNKSRDAVLLPQEESPHAQNPVPRAHRSILHPLGYLMLTAMVLVPLIALVFVPVTGAEGMFTPEEALRRLAVGWLIPVVLLAGLLAVLLATAPQPRRRRRRSTL